MDELAAWETGTYGMLLVFCCCFTIDSHDISDAVAFEDR